MKTASNHPMLQITYCSTTFTSLNARLPFAQAAGQDVAVGVAGRGYLLAQAQACSLQTIRQRSPVAPRLGDEAILRGTAAIVQIGSTGTQ